jgi:hypothetical protein
MHQYGAADAFPVFPPLGGFGTGPQVAMNQAKRLRAEVSFQPRPCQSIMFISFFRRRSSQRYSPHVS